MTETRTKEQWLDFNINYKVRVKLTERGKQILRDNYIRLWSDRPAAPYAYREPQEDADGWSTWQMWSLMQDLGHACALGFDPPFETTIQIDTEQR